MIDTTVDDMMNQDSNFIKTQEGYPFFFNQSRTQREINLGQKLNYDQD